MARETWSIIVTHDGLNKCQVVRGKTKYETENKAAILQQQWNEQWLQRQLREQAARNKEEKKQLAQLMTQEAIDSLKEIETILLTGIEATSKWSEGYFSIIAPEKEGVVKEIQVVIPTEPTFSEYQPRLSTWDCLIPGRKKKKLDEANVLFEIDHNEWKSRKNKIVELNKGREKEFQDKLSNAEEKYQWDVMLWKEKKAAYRSGDIKAIHEIITGVLSKSEYPAFLTKEYECLYRADSKLAIIDYILPNPECLPTLKEVKYIQTRDELKETHITENVLQQIYEKLIYQVTLRSIYEVFNSDKANHIQTVIFNGWINSIDKATGQEFTACIATVQTSKNDFMSLNLTMVDPKACFKKLKGISASKLYTLTPVPPIIQSDHDDPRFVNSYSVAETLDQTVNLAAMNWKDFENLIREVFEREFSGSNVRITRASRDGGVDAIVFDPDPIRGGKIVIQAKRYTNTVDVSAVRDLYGTVVNEGANLGILVTTSDYGPDAITFASSKPLRLLHGGNLLNILEKQGYHARIDLKEAKLLQAEQNNK